MRQRMRYLYIEVKKTISMLPRMLLQAILLMVLIGAVAFCGIKSMEKRTGQELLAVTLNIGVVMQEENMLTRMALDYVENLESVSETCHFIQVSEEEGRRMLAAGGLEAMVVLPGQLIEGIMNGQNPDVEIYFPPKSPGLEVLVMRQFVDTGTGLLQVAQAQGYGAYDTAVEYGLEQKIHDMERAIDRYNLEFVVDRLAAYKTQTVSATGRMGIAQYYAASAIVLFLLFSGMAMYPVMRQEPLAFVRQLKRQGTGMAWQCFCKWLCGFLCMGLFGGVAWALLRTVGFLVPEAGERASAILGNGADRYSMGARAGIFVLVMIAVSALVFLLYSLAGSRTSGILLIFLFSVVMVYLSGGLVPSVFMPLAMTAVGEKLPTAYMLQACGLLFGASVQTGMCVLWLCGYTAVFSVAAYLLQARKKGE